MELFLADLHVAVISIPLMDRGPLTVPIWYVYEPGGEPAVMLLVMLFVTIWRRTPGSIVVDGHYLTNQHCLMTANNFEMR